MTDTTPPPDHPEPPPLTDDDAPAVDVAGPDLDLGSQVELGKLLLDDLTRRAGVRPVHTRGETYCYDRATGVWSVYSDDAMAVWLHSFDGVRPASDPKRLKLTAGMVNGAISCARRHIGHPTFFEDAPAGLAFSNGFATVTRDGVVLQGHAPENRALTALPYAFDEHAPCPRWLVVLRQILEDPSKPAEDLDQRVQAFQEFLGAALAGIATQYQKCMVLLGDGANGKTLLLKVIENLFPPSALGSLPPQKWDSDYHRAGLAGVRLNVVSELPERELMETGPVKAIISGDRVDARHPYGRPFHFNAIAAQLFAANKLPLVTDSSHGHWRRWVVLELVKTFTDDPDKVDHAQQIYLGEPIDDLTQALLQELAGIMAWALAGCVRLLSRSAYTPVGSSEATVESWREESDPVLGYFRARVAITPEPSHGRYDAHNTTGRAELYNDYTAWCQRVGRKGVMHMTSFGRRVKKKPINLKVVDVDTSHRYNCTIRRGAEDLADA